METKVVRVGACSVTLQSELDAWFEEQFGHIPWMWATPDHYVLAYFEGALVGRLGIVDRTISVGDESIRVGGVGGVITRRQWRSQGVGRSLLSETNSFLRTQLGAPFGLLLCRDELRSYYEKGDWRVVPGPVEFTQPTGPAVYPHLAMALRCGEQDWPAGKIDLQGLPW